MKKFILVMVCTLLMTMLIAFNYLLWDRENKKKDIENLEQSKVSNSVSINALGRNIKELEDENRALNDTIELMEGNIKELDEYISDLESEKNKLIKILQQKNTVINKLKEEVDPSILEAPVRKWVQAINSGDYESVYNLQTAKMNQSSGFLNITDLENSYKNSIQSIKLKSIKLDMEEVPVETPGDICFFVTLDVKKSGNADVGKIQLEEGINNKLIAVDYDKEKNIWVISGIYTVK
jgi:septal ring factor EnvC (AmiA/AmiB activator)